MECHMISQRNNWTIYRALSEPLEGFLLAEDGERLIRQAQESAVLR